MRRLTLVLAILALTPTLAGCATPSEPGPRQAPPYDQEDAASPPAASPSQGLLDLAEQGSAWLDTPEEARQAGYTPAPYCVPGRGVRWLDHDAVDTHVDPLRPEILRFLPTTSNVTDEARQRFIGVEYVAVTEGTAHNSTADPPRVHGVPMDGPFPPGSPGEPWHAVLPVTLAEDLAGEDPFTDDPERVACPPNTTAPGVSNPAPPQGPPGEPVDARTLAACHAMTGRTVHDHAELVIYLDDATTPVDLSPDRYQLAAQQVHVEWGARDANGATVHVHAGGTTIGCFLATLGWQVSEDAIVTDRGEVYQEDAHHRIEVTVDGEPSMAGLATTFEHETRFVVRYADTAEDPSA